MKVSIICAIARNGVIGRDGDLPWRLPDDLKVFKRITMGHHIIMGRKTWESIGRALPGRTSVVVSRQASYAAPGATIVSGLPDALAVARSAGEEEAFVVGGGQLYGEALPECDRMYLTMVDADVDGDVWFPDIGSEWREVSRDPHPPDDRHAFGFSFVILQR